MSNQEGREVMTCYSYDSSEGWGIHGFVGTACGHGGHGLLRKGSALIYFDSEQEQLMRASYLALGSKKSLD